MKRRAWTREEASRELASLDASWHRALEAQRARRALDGAGSPLVDQAAASHPQPTPPVATTLPITVITHNFARLDNYSWLRDEYRNDPEVLEYLKKEAKYYGDSLMSEVPLGSKIAHALGHLMPPSVPDMPYRDSANLYQYATENSEGEEYPIIVRRSVPPHAALFSENEAVFNTSAETVLNYNKYAKDFPDFILGEVKVSPKNDRVAYVFDRHGEESYTLAIDHVPSGESSMKHHIEADPEDKKCRKIYRHVVGTDPADDVLTYKEPDITTMASVQEGDEYIILNSGHSSGLSIYVVRRDAPYAPWQPLLLGQLDMSAFLDEARGRAILHIHDAQEKTTTFYYISARSLRAISEGSRHDLRHFPVICRSNSDVAYLGSGMKGSYYFYIKDVKFQQSIVVHKFSPNDPAGYSQTWFVVDLGRRPGDVQAELFGSHRNVILRVTTSSPGRTTKVVEYNLDTRSSAVVHHTVHPTANMDDYVESIIEVKADDGARIPVSLFYRRTTPLNNSAPMLMRFYGFYGAQMPQRFKVQDLMLADQGFVMAHAHIRGGGELGMSWHLQGHLLNHKATLRDLILCMKQVVRLGYTSRDRLALESSSAGGTALTAVANMAPGAFQAGIAGMPFTDVLGSLLEEKLAHSDWLEFGNPKNTTAFEYIRSYNPYDNIRKQKYPHLLLTTALHDPRVPYWDPAKFVAKLRAHKTDDSMLFLSTDMSGGHFTTKGEVSAKMKKLRMLCFLFKALGVNWRDVYATVPPTVEVHQT